MIENTSGWFPLTHHVLVLPEEVDIKKGAIYILEETSRRDEMAQIQGVVVACGPEVFADKPRSKTPKTGDFVMFAKLAGFFVQGDDGKKYRMISDLDLVAVHSEERK